MLKFLHKKLTKKKWKAFRKILKPVFRDQIPDSMLTQLHIFFLHLLSKSKSGGRFLPIVSLSDASSRTGYLKPPEKFTTEAPQALGTKKVQRISQFTTIDFKLLNRVFAHPQSSVLLKDDKVCVPDYYLERYDFNICDQILLFWQSDSNMGVVYQPTPLPGPSGIMIFGAGVDNWYHWLIEYLPMVYMSHGLPKEFNKLPLIVPSDLLEIDQFKESLNLVCGTREVISIPHHLSEFETLIVVGRAVLEPIYFRYKHFAKIEHYSYNSSQLESFRSLIFQKLNISSRGFKEKIFLARGNNRRPYNQDELISIAETKGFRVIYTENLSFRDQVDLFFNAKYIVGASGAAFANTLFCQEGTRLLSWVSSEYAGFCSFSNLAKVTASELRYIFFEPSINENSESEDLKSSYVIPVDDFENALTTMLQSDDW